MARNTNSTRTVANAPAVEEVVQVKENADDSMTEEAAVKEKQAERKVVNPEPLTKETPIDVVSLIPHVSYKDSHTGDIYRWDEIGQVETLSFEVIQNMWQKYKTYFRSMWLKPLDERVIKKFALEKTYAQYEYLMDAANYTRENIDEICNNIAATPSSLKSSLCIKVRSFVDEGKVTDISVIDTLEKKLNIELYRRQ